MTILRTSALLRISLLARVLVTLAHRETEGVNGRIHLLKRTSVANYIEKQRRIEDKTTRHRRSSDINDRRSSDLTDIAMIGDYVDPSMVLRGYNYESISRTSTPSMNPSSTPTSRWPSTSPSLYPSKYPSKSPSKSPTTQPSIILQLPIPILHGNSISSATPSSTAVSSYNNEVKNTAFVLSFVTNSTVLTYHGANETLDDNELLNITSRFLHQNYLEALENPWTLDRLIVTFQTNTRRLKSFSSTNNHVVLESFRFEALARFQSTNVPSTEHLDNILRKSFEGDHMEIYMSLLKASTNNILNLLSSESVTFSFISVEDTVHHDFTRSTSQNNLFSAPGNLYEIGVAILAVMTVVTIVASISYFRCRRRQRMEKQLSSRTNTSSSTSTSTFLNQMETCEHGQIHFRVSGTEVILHEKPRAKDTSIPFNRDISMPSNKAVSRPLDQDTSQATISAQQNDGSSWDGTANYLANNSTFNSEDSSITDFYWNDSQKTIPALENIPFCSQDTNEPNDAIIIEHKDPGTMLNYLKISSAKQ